MTTTFDIAPDWDMMLLQDGSLSICRKGVCQTLINPEQVAALRDWLSTPPGSKYPDDMDPIERDIIDLLVRDALAAGYKIQVSGDDIIDLEASNSYGEITGTIGACSETTLVVSKIGQKSQWFLLIHGNGAHVISDYSNTPEANILITRANALAEKMGA